MADKKKKTYPSEEWSQTQTKRMKDVAEGAAPKIVPIEIPAWGNSTNDQNTYFPTNRDETIDSVREELKKKPHGKRTKRTRGAKYTLGEL